MMMPRELDGLNGLISEQVNEIRVQNGLSKLPHIQQELEAQMAK